MVAAEEVALAEEVAVLVVVALAAEVAVLVVVVDQVASRHISSVLSLGSVVTVGMSVTRHPPYRSVRALLTHTAPTSSIWRENESCDIHLAHFHALEPTLTSQVSSSVSGYG